MVHNAFNLAVKINEKTKAVSLHILAKFCFLIRVTGAENFLSFLRPRYRTYVLYTKLQALRKFPTSCKKKFLTKIT